MPLVLKLYSLWGLKTTILTSLTPSLWTHLETCIVSQKHEFRHIHAHWVLPLIPNLFELLPYSPLWPNLPQNQEHRRMFRVLQEPTVRKHSNPWVLGSLYMSNVSSKKVIGWKKQHSRPFLSLFIRLYKKFCGALLYCSCMPQWANLYASAVFTFIFII